MPGSPPPASASGWWLPVWNRARPSGGKAPTATRGSTSSTASCSAYDGSEVRARGGKRARSAKPTRPPRFRADAPTELVHVGPVATSAPSGGLFGPADAEGHGVHVIAAQDADAIDFGAFTQVCFTDSTCPTCRINWFRVTGADEPYVVGSHLHSEDEIIHVLSGSASGRPAQGVGRYEHRHPRPAAVRLPHGRGVLVRQLPGRRVNAS